MKSSLILLVLIVLAATVFSASAAAQAGYPRMNSCTPDAGKVGDILTVEGSNLDRGTVKGLYLTDGKTDWKTEIVEQSGEAIKFKIPGDAKPGRFSLMVLTGGSSPKLIEQPVKVTVEA